jgi:urease accessory protein
VQGQFQQHLEVEGTWLERGCLRADDHRLLHSPLGLNGHSGQATLLLAQGSDMNDEERARITQLARDVCEGHSLRLQAGVSSPNPRVVVLRVLSDQLEPAVDLLKKVWLQWHSQLWGMPAVAPRIWAM